ncbi:6-phosphofructokinase [Roseateles sp. DAIF2]|uniref:ATP-dependent 6-phosphofructokinase n=1 Tax=Roseateles sp. DAIF2 TaxID=2714952 RepID=UPI0018A2A060|nr:ATP-dependent 6-phosphofructokinase [Roseateles sp. DAIF2]QPF73479.1 6-phosphofructokinase [Roseateles sp. DAIF2]
MTTSIEKQSGKAGARLAVLTSGGDAPGMNAALRAVVRVGAARGFEVFGVQHGFSGLIAGELRPLGPRDVGGIIERGGTLLGSARCAALKTEAGQLEALAQLQRRGIEHLVVIGGNGSQTGAWALARRGLAVAGVASTIDNDLPGSDITIGCTTAVDVALESVDRLRTTASSQGRVFLVEVMGRDCGYLALQVGIASGAELIVTPEASLSAEAVAAGIREAYGRGKSHAIIVVAEGASLDAEALAKRLAELQQLQPQTPLGFELRVCRLGHVQRGGAPGAVDRLLGTRLGAAAVDCLAEGVGGMLLGQIGGRLARTPLAEVAGSTKAPDPALLELARTLAL